MDPNVDDDIRAMKRANRRPLWLGLGVVVAAVAVVGLHVLGGASSVKSSLEQDGYVQVAVKMNGPFEYGFTAKKGTATCGGTVTHTPLSTSRSETCFDAK